MKKYLFIFALVILSLPFFISAQTQSSGTNVNLTVLGCNYNAICEANLGETYLSCPTDCAAPPPANGTSSTSTSGTATAGYAPQSAGGGTSLNGSPKTLRYDSFTITTDLTDATMSWYSGAYSKNVISWGTNSEYANGGVSETSYSNSHLFYFQNLLPGTTYYYSIQSLSIYGQTSSEQGEFTTQSPPPPVVYPANVTHLKATNTPAGIQLTWQNPTTAQFSEVRVVRTMTSYSDDPDLGKIVYEGSRNNSTDSDVESGQTYYYTVFSFDNAGNFSSGAVTRMRYQLGANGTSERPPREAVPSIPISNFDFFVGAKQVNLINGSITASSSDILRVSVPISILSSPENLLVFDLNHRSDVYIFRKTSDGSRLEVDVPLDGQSGATPFSIRQYAGENGVQSAATGTILLPVQASSSQVFQLSPPLQIGVLLLLILLIIIIRVLVQKLL